MKTIDQIYHCQIPSQLSGFWQLQCHLRIFQPYKYKEVQIVTLDSMGFEINWFIPYILEQLVERIVSEFHLDPAKLIWVESYAPHCDQPTYADCSQINFDWKNEKATNPQWTPLTLEVAQALMGENLHPARLLLEQEYSI
jgi:hypothetical protein